MLRYRLDDLGWFHFEGLSQALIKADLGVGVEHWGGSDDHGRDLYCAGALSFPDRRVTSPGPFIFQVKFVEFANAAGADHRAPLQGAVRKELDRIQERRDANKWKDPTQYVLITNCGLSPALRRRIAQYIGEELPSTQVTILDGEDVCGMVDNHPSIRSSFPEILGLRDLTDLLRESVSSSVLQRSRFALAEYRDLLPVFVPTAAYREASHKLALHHFVVLDGPPEMGKTTIASAIALTYLTDEYELLDCAHPTEFLQLYDREQKQCFVADDAFGRTEYDPERGRAWERDISRILSRTDTNHKLIWTSRRYVLERALQELDLQGSARHFPRPGEVTVRADLLTQEERARILYRHARAARLTESIRSIIRSKAEIIVRNPHFTPERIRRLVTDVLSHYSGPPQDLDRLISEAIERPTDRMSKSFAALSDDHKWVLVALLDTQTQLTRRMLPSVCSRFAPDMSLIAINRSVDDLVGTFLRTGSNVYGITNDSLEWIHPSYRDLVLSELAASYTMQRVFLHSASIAGLTVALTPLDTLRGSNRLPLMSCPDAWTIVEPRLVQMVVGRERYFVKQLTDVMWILGRDRTADPALRSKLFSVLESMARSLMECWSIYKSEVAIEMLSEIVRSKGPRVEWAVLPSILEAWEMASSAIHDSINDRGYPSTDDLELWSQCQRLVELAYESRPQPVQYEQNVVALVEELRGWAMSYGSEVSDESDYDANDSIASSLEAGLRILEDNLPEAVYPSVHDAAVESIESHRAHSERDDTSGRARDYGDSTRDYGQRQIQPFSIAALFRDL